MKKYNLFILKKKNKLLKKEKGHRKHPPIQQSTSQPHKKYSNKSKYSK